MSWIQQPAWICYAWRHRSFIWHTSIRQEVSIADRQTNVQYNGPKYPVLRCTFTVMLCSNRHSEENYQFVQLKISSLLLLSGEVSHKPPPSRTQNLMRRISSTRESGELTPKKLVSNHDLYTLNCFIHTKLITTCLYTKKTDCKTSYFYLNWFHNHKT